jgi:hypothetical protein
VTAGDRREVEFGRAVAVDVPAGHDLVVAVAAGRQLADVCVAGLHQGLTRNAAGWRRFGRPSLALWLLPGDELVDGDARPIMRVEACPDAGLDAAYPGCWSELHPDGRPGCRDLLAAALGVPRAGLPGVLSAFGAAPRVGPDGLHGWEAADAPPGAAFTLRALRDCRAAVSACPDDGIPGTIRGRLEVAVTEGRGDPG